jgi:monovalent cation/hydrogen antiporter
MMGDMRGDEEMLARMASARAALAEIERIAEAGLLPEAELDRLRTEFTEHLHAVQGSADKSADAHAHGGALEQARLGIIESERDALLMLRRSKQIGDEILQKLVRELDLAELALRHASTAA